MKKKFDLVQTTIYTRQLSELVDFSSKALLQNTRILDVKNFCYYEKINDRFESYVGVHSLEHSNCILFSFSIFFRLDSNTLPSHIVKVCKRVRKKATSTRLAGDTWSMDRSHLTTLQITKLTHFTRAPAYVACIILCLMEFCYTIPNISIPSLWSS